MRFGRLFAMLLVLALALAPAGRGLAMPASAHHQPAGVVADHCGDSASHLAQVPAPSTEDGEELECPMACAALAAVASCAFDPGSVVAASPEGRVQHSFPGFRPEADPPPPRRS